MVFVIVSFKSLIQSLFRILYLTDPETFASLVLADQAWRSASETPHLYAHHLSRCPSFSRSHMVVGGPFTEDSLPRLKRQFAREVKRNLFEAYLQPRRTLVSLVSTTTSSAAAFPGGEAFDFAFSPNGHWVLALSSSRIYVIDTLSPKISVQRELKVQRRPVSAAILDDGSTLAVLSGDHQVNVYNLSNRKVKHSRAISLDNHPHAIALAPRGEVLAAAFEGGIELHSLAPIPGPSDHRDIKCDRVDSLAFSTDGALLMGTTKHGTDPNTVVLSAPYYTEDHHHLPAFDQISHLWTSQILFPHSSRDCGNATLLPNRSDGDTSWTFTYDKVFESFRAVRTDDLRNGTTYFTGPKPPKRDGPRNTRKKLTPCTLPASSECGELVAAGFLGKEVWLYGVPEGLDEPTVTQTDDPNSQSTSSSRPNTPGSGIRSPARSFTRGEAAELTRLPKWQVLVDKYRNVFAKGRLVAEISGVSSVRWVTQKSEKPLPSSLKERLVIAAPGGIPGDPELEQDGFASVDGGRLVILDFDRTSNDGRLEEVVFEVGNDTPELLDEEHIDIDTEVALVRQRTVRNLPHERRTVVDALSSTLDIPDLSALAPTANAIANANAAAAAANASANPDPGQSPVQNTDSPDEGLSLEEASEFFDGPYSHTQPRSRTSLYRSATAVAANRQRNPPRIIAEARRGYRRPDGRGELPHESDADNWVPPPPPYTPDSDRPLPEHLRATLLPRSTEPYHRDRSGWGGRRPASAGTVYGSPVSTGRPQRINSLPQSHTTPLRQRSPDATSPLSLTRRSVSDSVSLTPCAVSPMSNVDFSFNDIPSEPSVISPESTTATTARRPMSSLIGRMSSLHKSNKPRLTSPILPLSTPSTPERLVNHTVSLPTSPASRSRPGSPLTLTGANLQHRLKYPLPPAPNGDSAESLNRRYDLDDASSSERTSVALPPRQQQDPSPLSISLESIMPSAQQLATLNNRSRQARPPQGHGLPSGIFNIQGYPVPAPPRGALGAAGSSTFLASRAHTRSSSRGNQQYSRSSPALVRPRPQRLETIESMSSLLTLTRSRSRDLRLGRPASRRRSQSMGPALRPDRARTKKGWLSGKKLKKGKVEQQSGEDTGNDGDGKGTKCIVM